MKISRFLDGSEHPIIISKEIVDPSINMITWNVDSMYWKLVFILEKDKRTNISYPDILDL